MIEYSSDELHTLAHTVQSRSLEDDMRETAERTSHRRITRIQLMAHTLLDESFQYRTSEANTFMLWHSEADPALVREACCKSIEADQADIQRREEEEIGKELWCLRCRIEDIMKFIGEESHPVPLS